MIGRGLNSVRFQVQLASFINKQETLVGFLINQNPS
jgi:hypothetical protein